MTVTSQMTQEEVLEYVAKVLKAAGLEPPAAKPSFDDAARLGGRFEPSRQPEDEPPHMVQLRAQAVLAVVQVCGRPIAKAEIAAIEKAEEQFNQARDERGARVGGALSRLGEVRPVQAADSPFAPPTP